MRAFDTASTDIRNILRVHPTQPLSSNSDLSSANSQESADMALTSLDPAQCAALLVAAFAERIAGVTPDLVTLVDELDAAMARARTGDMSDLEDALVAQAASLQAIFTALSVRTLRNFEMTQTGAQWMKLALRAQAQARSTIHTLADMKRPAFPAVFARQANFASGHQQVNNAAISCACCSSPPSDGHSPSHCPDGCDLV